MSQRKIKDRAILAICIAVIAFIAAGVAWGVAAHKIKKAQTELGKLQGNIESKEEEYEILETKYRGLASLEEQLNAADRMNTNLQAELGAINTEIYRVTDELATAEKDKEGLSAANKDLSKQVTDANSENAKLKKQIGKNENERIKFLADDLKKANETINKLNNERIIELQKELGAKQQELMYYTGQLKACKDAYRDYILCAQGEHPDKTKPKPRFVQYPLFYEVTGPLELSLQKPAAANTEDNKLEGQETEPDNTSIKELQEKLVQTKNECDSVEAKLDACIHAYHEYFLCATKLYPDKAKPKPFYVQGPSFYGVAGPDEYKLPGKDSTNGAQQ